MSFSENSEVIIIDNGSADNSYEWIRKNYPKITIIQNSKNLGVTAAWNQGLELSSGQYICIANNDLIFSKNCIKLLQRALEKHKWIGMRQDRPKMTTDMMNEYMDGRMNGWKGDRRNGRIMDGWNGEANGGMDGWKCVYGMERRTDEWTDGIDV